MVRLNQKKARHLLEITCALLFTMQVPKVFLAYALLTASYLMNCIPTMQVPKVFKLMHS